MVSSHEGSESPETPEATMDGGANNSDEEQLSNQLSSFSFGPKLSPPITLLQEICSRNGFTPEYQLLSTEGCVHEPTFKMAVTVDDITVTASGQSKKKARHAAAREAIEKLRQRTNLNFQGINFESMTSLGEPSAKSVYAMAVSEANPVGKLQEICMKMRVNPPDYDTCAEKGLAHERIFTLSCTITNLNMTTVGEGRSKKLAKRQAAENMLAKLESSEIYDKAASVKTDEPGASSLNMDSDDNSHFVRSRSLVTKFCQQLEYNVNDLWMDIEMIETDNIDEDLFYKLFQETVTRIGACRFNWVTDSQCVLHVFDPNDKNEEILLSATGEGDNNIIAMKDAVINAYKKMMCLLRPLTGKEARLHHRTVGSPGLPMGS